MLRTSIKIYLHEFNTTIKAEEFIVVDRIVSSRTVSQSD
jgi:hypothetical protein